MTSPGASRGHVEKLMSIRLEEFEAGVARLNGGTRVTGSNGRYVVPSGSGDVTIAFEKLEPAVLGGLMRLPRARVTIDLTGFGDDDARRDFLAFFDRTFQRGGG